MGTSGEFASSHERVSKGLKAIVEQESPALVGSLLLHSMAGKNVAQLRELV